MDEIDHVGKVQRKMNPFRFFFKSNPLCQRLTARSYCAYVDRTRAASDICLDFGERSFHSTFSIHATSENVEPRSSLQEDARERLQKKLWWQKLLQSKAQAKAFLRGQPRRLPPCMAKGKNIAQDDDEDEYLPEDPVLKKTKVKASRFRANDVQ